MVAGKPRTTINRGGIWLMRVSRFLAALLRTPILRLGSLVGGNHFANAASGCLGALGIHVHGVQRLARGHKQSIFLGATKTKIRTRFPKMNLAYARAVRRANMHALEVRSAPSRGGPPISARIA